MNSMKIAIVATSLLLATAIPASAGNYGGGGTNWGAIAGAGILGGLLGAAAAPQQQPQIIVVVPPQPAYVAPQPAPRISDREFLEHYAPPAPTYVSPPPWCGETRRWYPATQMCVAQ
jgi:hypothetical protein